MSNCIAILGAGFSGTVVAANLMRRPPPGIEHIVLIEPRACAGRGLAYAARGFPYLLNVPAARLSADSKHPQQFLRFAQATLPGAGPEDFLPRELYGDYLEDFLARAQREAPAGLTVTRICDEATDLSGGRGAAPFAVSLSRSTPIDARIVILALGNPPPRLPPWAGPLLGNPAYRDDPWDLPPGFSGEHSVLIVGNGLTMIDVAYFLTRSGATAPRLVTISRRGLIPLTQSAFHAAAVKGGPEFFEGADTIRKIVAASRALARDVERLGGDWREVVTFIRSMLPHLWERLPERERRRFVRHVQGHWDVHRHRLPPELAAHIEGLRAQGGLDVNAGRIDAVVPAGAKLEVTWRRRGRTAPQTLLADAVVNATGPDYVIRRSRNRLLQTLRSRGLVAEDPLELGLRTGTHGVCVDTGGRVNERLFYLGPMLRAGHWESTAATELRNHAESLARHLAVRAP